MTDLSHLNALRLRLSHESVRLEQAKTQRERDLRAVWVAGIQREIESELLFLGIADDDGFNGSTDDLLAELMA
jgi:hypothetical protein